MISYQVYKIMHIAGISLILLGLAAILGAYANSTKITGRFRLAAFVSHGLGMLLALTGGFGMAARLGLVHGLPSWIYAKLIIWVLLGLAISLAKRKAQWTFTLIMTFTVLIGTATGIAIYKPSFSSSDGSTDNPPAVEQPAGP
jgi:hypothetical protein